MSKIRKDFEGVTIVRDASGRAVMLKAGDKIPDGVKVGSHLLSTKGDPSPAPVAPVPAVVPESTAPASAVVPEPTPPAAVPASTPPPKAGAGSSADAWRAYALAETAKRGLSVEIPEGSSRGDIIEALEGAQIPTE